MRGEHACFVTRIACGPALEHETDAAVELAPAAKRQTLVRDGVDKRVAETEPARSIPVDQTAQPLPHSIVRRDLVTESRREQIGLERNAENGRVPEHDSIRERKPVDVGSHDRLDRVGELVGRPGGARDVEQLDEEQRASAGSPRELLDLVRPERVLVSCDLDDLRSVAL